MNWKPLFCCIWVLLGIRLSAVEPCIIRVVDDQSDWPVPLVRLTSNHNVSLITDNAGIVAFDLPELMGVETWFKVSADGYELKPDGFGYRGFRFTPKPGGETEVRIHRTIIAKRLGRLTGAGIFAESQKAGNHLEWQESGILGSDSVQIAEHRGKLFWAWGDTKLPHYPLGLFHTASATTSLRPLSQFVPPIRIELNYFRERNGTVCNVANLAPDEPGPTWIGGYVSLPDAEGKNRLVACYAKITPPLSAYRYGLCVWNDDTSEFESIRVLWDKSSGKPAPDSLPNGHPANWEDQAGKRWLLFGNPFPTIQMPANFEGWNNPNSWKSLQPGKSVKDAEANQVMVHTGSIAWNSFRKRWVTVFVEKEGDPSYLGEVWYAEAQSPFGPWGTAVKVLSHQQYTFYNPRIHPDLTPKGSPILLFEGTYTQTFSSAKSKTPRHDYNQILYRLDLNDPALIPARNNP